MMHGACAWAFGSEGALSQKRQLVVNMAFLYASGVGPASFCQNSLVGFSNG
jgi:hypothetical protein